MGKAPAPAGGGTPIEVAVIGGRDKHVHAIRLEDGKALWTFPTRAKVDASPVIAGQRVIAASYDGNLYLLELASGTEVWKFAGGGPFLASPAVAGGRLVIGNDDGAVYCFDLQPGAR
jgi:outer membrane protein assembly factor BamB